MTRSNWCQWQECGCLQDTLWGSLHWKYLFVTQSSLWQHSSSHLWPLLSCPLHEALSILTSLSVPTWVLKSPRIYSASELRILHISSCIIEEVISFWTRVEIGGGDTKEVDWAWWLRHAGGGSFLIRPMEAQQWLKGVLFKAKPTPYCLCLSWDFPCQKNMKYV